MPEVSQKPFRATMRDVANRANVTIATVSHVLNGTAKISEETTERVNAAIRELNYRPNLHAQALRKPNSKSIGYLVPDITTNFYSSFFSCFVGRAYEYAYSVSAINFRHNPAYEAAELQNLIDKNVDAILVHNGFDDLESLELVQRAGIPLILLDRHQDNFSYIAFDNTKTVRRLVGLLKASGYTRIGYISESVIVQNLNDRYIGYLCGMQENGLETDLRDVLINRQPEIDSMSIGYQLMQQRIEEMGQHRLPEVFVASSDLVALGALRAIRKAGLHIPQDIAITGCDNLQLSSYIDPPLTTIHQSAITVAEHAWDMLNSLFAHPEQAPYVEMLTQQLVVRDSAPISEALLRSTDYADFILR